MNCLKRIWSTVVAKNQNNLSLGNNTVLNEASDLILVQRRVGWKVLHTFCINLRIFVLVFLSWSEKEESSVIAAVGEGRIAIKTNALSPLTQMLSSTGGWKMLQFQAFSRCPSPTSFTHHQAYMYQENFSKAADTLIPERELWLTGDIQYVCFWTNKCNFHRNVLGLLQRTTAIKNQRIYGGINGTPYSGLEVLFPSTVKSSRDVWKKGAVCKEVSFHPFNFLHFHHRRQQ